MFVTVSNSMFGDVLLTFKKGPGVVNILKAATLGIITTDELAIIHPKTFAHPG